MGVFAFDRSITPYYRVAFWVVEEDLVPITVVLRLEYYLVYFLGDGSPDFGDAVLVEKSLPFLAGHGRPL